MQRSTHEALREYREKRRFARTPEPKGGGRTSGDSGIFVVQKHAATRLHYDFRLEMDGVLKSWAVPKGPSTDPEEKRLAVQTEDHPLEYADFEGIIPEGEYGGGTVIVWDTGHYRNLKDSEAEPVGQSLRKGHITVWLEGRKLKGGYALIRTGKPPDGERWLLMKMKDKEADHERNPVVTEPRSVVSGLTIEEMALRG